MANPFYYVGQTVTFELSLTLTTLAGAVTPVAASISLVLEKPDGTKLTKSVTASGSIFYYTTLTSDLTPAGSWSRYWTYNDGTTVIPATAPIPFTVRAVP